MVLILTKLYYFAVLNINEYCYSNLLLYNANTLFCTFMEARSPR